MSANPFIRLALCLTVLALALPAQAQVYGRPVLPKMTSTNNNVMTDTLKAVANLTSQNRGNDATSLLANGVANGIIPSDHRTIGQMTPQDMALMSAINSGTQVNAAQVLDVVNHLCHARRGDDAATLYANAVSSGIIKATP